MKQDCIYTHEIKERGYVLLGEDKMSDCEKKKARFVSAHLMPTLIAANAGWRSATYVVMAGKHNVRNEYVVLSNSTTSPLDGRYISVNMDSHIAIVRDVLDNIY